MKKRDFWIGVVGGAVVMAVTLHAQDLNTMLSLFLKDLQAGTMGASQPFSSITLTGAASSIKMGGSTAAFPMLLRNGTRVDVKTADNAGFADVAASTVLATGGVLGASGSLLVNTGATPTISSGFGSTPAASVTSSNGATTFQVNVGGGGVATSGVIGMPAATAGWNCLVSDITTNIVTRETASTTASVTVTAASAWGAQNILLFHCLAF
jgi:hypothetical protein